MKPAEVKELMISSLSADENSVDILKKLEDAGVEYSYMYNCL